MPTDPSVRASLQAARYRVGAETVRHPHFESTASRLRETASSHPLSLLLGCPAWARPFWPARWSSSSTAPSPTIPPRCVRCWSPPPCRTARGSPGGSSGSPCWTRSTIRFPRARWIVRPWPTPCAAGSRHMIQRATEGALRRAVSAARRRGLEWLFADEAVALVKAEHGRVLRRVAGRPFRAPRSRAGTPSRGLRVRTQPPPSTSHSPPTAAVFQATPPPRHDRQGRDRDSGRGPARESAEGERGLVIFEKDNSIAPSFLPSDLYCYLFGRGATD